jgi:hypothetical protein
MGTVMGRDERDRVMTLWRPEEPAGHEPWCVWPEIHPATDWCASDPTEAGTMEGKPSKAWLAAHPGIDGPPDSGAATRTAAVRAGPRRRHQTA